jgi:hypothetical protein
MGSGHGCFQFVKIYLSRIRPLKFLVMQQVGQWSSQSAIVLYKFYSTL